MGHTIFPRWYDSMEFQIGLIEITVITCISASSKLLQVPFSFSKYCSLTYILLCKYLLFKFALPFSLPPTYKRLVQPYQGFLWLSRYSETFLRTFITHMYIQSLPCSHDAATIAENWSLTERRFRHLERTVLGRYLLSCDTVVRLLDWEADTNTETISWFTNVEYIPSHSIFDQRYKHLWNALYKYLYPCPVVHVYIMNSCMFLHRCMFASHIYANNYDDCIHFNSLWLSYAYMHKKPRPSLVQIMACRLVSAKPLSKPMLEYCKLDQWLY